MNIERLKQLAAGLRKLKPEDYNHRDMCKCALGHCRNIFPDLRVEWFGFHFASQWFNLLSNETNWLFNDNLHYPVPDEEVTPEMVADRIDAFLAY